MALDKTTLYAAAITGGFALAGTAISGYFSYKSSQPPEPAPVAPPLMSATIPAPLTAPSAPPNYRLNFAAFQRVMKDGTAPENVKSQAVAQCESAQVIWNGYVEAVTPHSSKHAAGDAAATVTLCEERELLDQSMFKQPAYCRFGVAELAALEALAPGTPVTVTGTFEQHSAVGTILTGCRVLETVRR